MENEIIQDICLGEASVAIIQDICYGEAFPPERGSPFAGPSSGTRRREHASSDSGARRPGPRIELPGSSARAPRDLCTPEGRASLRAREAPPRASIDRRWPDVFVAKSANLLHLRAPSSAYAPCPPWASGFKRVLLTRFAFSPQAASFLHPRASFPGFRLQECSCRPVGPLASLPQWAARARVRLRGPSPRVG